jgi:hypothetical protein
MRERALSGLLNEGEFLVCYDYGIGGLWGILIAPSGSRDPGQVSRPHDR